MSETTTAGNHVPSDLEIAQRAVMKPIGEIAAAAGITPDALELYGPYKAKIDPAKLTPGAHAQPGGTLVYPAADGAAKAIH